MLTKPVIKIEVAGSVTSFRYPHFTQGFQPTYDMPPPSTIYGHICSAVGDWVDPVGLEFGYHFTYDKKFVDYKEHLHFEDPVQPFPFDRELLFNPRLTLYINDLDLWDVFQSPYFPVALGRSQDLMTYLSVQVVELEAREVGYFEHTLLPPQMAPHFDKGLITVTMARFINQRRQSTWSTYSLLRHKVIWPPERQESHNWDDDEVLYFEDTPEIPLWIDPTSPAHPKYADMQRAIYFHKFVED